ncbi:MAG: ABC transporter permease, partial [Gammaproteobacteria bacterium]|nr:ABC transporter permease [Gammaproteobacteria bacterium]
MSIFSLAFKSLRNRKFTILLTVLVIALSVTLLLGVDRIRHEARNSFTNTISGTDLIVGARSGRIALLLSSVFHIG